MYRVNAGGPAVSGSPSWSADTDSSPSPFVNASAAAAFTYSTTANIDVSHASIPAGTPASLFQNERADWVDASSTNMQWSFPVTAGTYDVRLYFAEIFFFNPNSRVFDVSIEGNVVLNDYDIVADVGAFKGVVRTFRVTADSTLNIDFKPVIENPKVNAIEILSVTQADALGASPQSISLGTVSVLSLIHI